MPEATARAAPVRSRSGLPGRSGAARLLAPPRVLGVDVARGVAVLTMMGAHVGIRPELEWARPSTWTALVDGRPSLLFALLAGVSTALVTATYASYDLERVRVVRLRLLGRGAVVFAIGVALELLGTSIAVILTLYGVLFVAVIPFLGWRRRHLLLLATVLALLGPGVSTVLAVVAHGAFGPGANLVLFGAYPAALWLAMLLVGLAVGRSDLSRVPTVGLLLVTGAGLAMVGYALGSLAGDEQPETTYGGGFTDPASFDGFGDYLGSQRLGEQVRTATLAVAPHSGGALEAVGSGGFVVAVLAACLLLGLLLARPARWLLLPIAAVGSMPLTVYAAHVVAVAVLVTWRSAPTDNTLWGQMCLAALVGATLWAAALGRGPLERLTARVADAAAVARPTRADVERSNAPSPTLEES